MYLALNNLQWLIYFKNPQKNKQKEFLKNGHLQSAEKFLGQPRRKWLLKKNYWISF